MPFIGSAGEKWRQRQSRYQLPPQDSDVRYCEDLNSEEADTLRMFERTRKTECLGSGVVQYAPFATKCEKVSFNFYFLKIKLLNFGGTANTSSPIKH